MKFIYDTGLRREVFHNVRLRGTFIGDGAPGTAYRWSQGWSLLPMQQRRGEDGAILFEVDVPLSAEDVGKEFRWAVLLDGPYGLELNGIVTECASDELDRCYRSFVLADDPHAEQRYYLTHIRRLGAQKSLDARPGRSPASASRSGRPHARKVEVVFGQREYGYIADDGTGIDPEHAGHRRCAPDGTGSGWPGPREDPVLSQLRRLRRRALHVPHHQGGRRGRLPHGPVLTGAAGPGRDQPAAARPTKGAPRSWTAWSAARWWWTPSWSAGRWRRRWPIPSPGCRSRSSGRTSSTTPGRSRTGSRTWSSTSCTWGRWGSASRAPGTFEDAIALLDYLVELGVNAVELLPVAEFNGTRTWGYGNSHHFAINASAGGPRSVPALRARVPPARHRRAGGRGLQPLRPRRRAGPVALRLRPGGAQPLLLVRGQGRATTPAPTAATWTTCPAASPRA